MSRQLKILKDEDLVKQYQSNGEKSIVGELFRRHSLMCFAVCNKYLNDEDASQDATMQIFEKLFTDLKKHEVLNFRSWLHSVCRNYSLMQLRKPEHLRRVIENFDNSENEFMEFEGFSHQEEDSKEKEVRLQLLEEAILELKDKQKECISLFYIELKSYEEVSQITGYSCKEVKSHIQNGKRNLKIILSQKGISFWLVFSTWILNIA